MYFCASAKTCVANAEYVAPDDLIVDVGGSRMKGRGPGVQRRLDHRLRPG
jgi:hypothetical protein